MAATVYKTDKQQDPTVLHRELYSISCNKLNGKCEKEYVYMHIPITESLCCIPETQHY